MLEVSIEHNLGSFNLDVSFSLNKGVLGLLGSSGCGKSMTLKTIAGFFAPDNGEIKLNGEIFYSSKQKINLPSRKRKIGYVFQNYALFPHMTVYKNIDYGIKHLKKDERYKKVNEMIARMQLEGLSNHYPSQLSGGQQQRTALARTLIAEPDLLLLDEPFSALDAHVKQLLEIELIELIKNSYNGIVLLVTHDIEEAYRICDQIMIIEKGMNYPVMGKKDLICHPPNLTAAMITGCKNFLDVTLIDESDENLRLQSGRLIFDAVKPVQPVDGMMTAGIRAHHLRFVPKDSVNDNNYAVEVVEVIEGVYSNTIIVNCSGCVLRVETSKTFDFGMPEEWLLHIPAKRVFLIKRDQRDKH